MSDWYDTGEGSEHVKRQWGESARNNPVPSPLCAGCERLKAEIDQYRWIPVAEGLPKYTADDGDGYKYTNTVEITDGLHIGDASFSKAHNEWHGTCFGIEFMVPTKNITHWKPIILPKESKNETDTQPLLQSTGQAHRRWYLCMDRILGRCIVGFQAAQV